MFVAAPRRRSSTPRARGTSGPTTWVSSSRSFACFERPRSARDSSQSRIAVELRLDPAREGDRVAGRSKRKADARVIRSLSTYVRKPPDSADGARAAVERDREPAFGVGERHVDGLRSRPRSTSRPRAPPARSRRARRSIGPTTATRDDRDAGDRLGRLARTARGRGRRPHRRRRGASEPPAARGSSRGRSCAASGCGTRCSDGIWTSRRRGQATSRGHAGLDGPREAAGRRCPA